MNKQKPKIGLALGSGAARGWAHIGVIEALLEKGIEISLIAGTSAGALVGGVYAAGSLDVLKEITLNLNTRQILGFTDISRTQAGIIDGKKLEKFVRENVVDIDFDELSIPLKVVSTDLKTGREVVISEGDLIDALRASTSIPGLFTPVSKDRMLLVDGALVNPLPVDIAREMGADYVIAVDLNYGTGSVDKSKALSLDRLKFKPPKLNVKELPDRPFFKRVSKIIENLENFDIPAISRTADWLEKRALPGFTNILLASYNILENQVTESKLKTHPADLLIRPDLSDIGFLDFQCAEEVIEIGYKTTLESIEKFPY